MTTGFEEQLMRAIGRIWKSNWGWIVLALLGAIFAASAWLSAQFVDRDHLASEVSRSRTPFGLS